MEYDIVIGKFGTKFYYKKGTKRLHREDGPAVEFVSGTKYWCIDGKYHRENYPAIEGFQGDKQWYINGKLHRENGPAVTWGNGDKEWWINGIRLSAEKEAVLNKWWDNKNGI